MKLVIRELEVGVMMLQQNDNSCEKKIILTLSFGEQFFKLATLMMNCF